MYEAVKHNELIKLVDNLDSYENYDYSDSDLDYSVEYGQYPYFQGNLFDFSTESVLKTIFSSWHNRIIVSQN